jgi:DNA modification methylase
MKDDVKMDIIEFLRKNIIPYDPGTDSYEKKPYDHPVKAGKNTPIYNAHSYHTKVPYQGIIPFIEHYTKPGGLILDPFCGSGMTGVAGLLCPTGPRKSILNDLSPAAVHIARNYCTPCDVEKLKEEFEKIKTVVHDEFAWLYETYHEDPQTGQKLPASIQYTIWSDVYQCYPKKRSLSKHPINPDGCKKDIVLWEVAVDKDSGEVREKFPCPHCGETWRKTELRLLRSDPVIANYIYIDPKTKKKHRGEHRVTEFELARIKEIEKGEIPYWYPQNPFEDTREMWRGIHRDSGINRACDFYTKRNLWALARLWNEFKNSSLSDPLAFVFTAVLLKGTKTTRYNFGKRGNSTITGTLYVGSFTVENNIMWVIERKFADSLPAFQVGKSGHCLTSSCHAGEIDYLSDSSIDYIFTDPPFGSNIFYADCSFLWESWLGEFTDESKEAVWNKSRKPSEGGKTLDDYHQLMLDSFKEMYRVLKPNRWATVVFSNSDDKVWEAIQEAAHQAGFVVYGGKEFDKIQRSFKGTKGEKGEEKVISKDVLLNLHKPLIPLVRDRELKKIDDIEGFVLGQIKLYLQYLARDAPSSERTVEAITRSLQRRIITEGYSMRGLSASYVADVLSDARRKGRLIEVSGTWFIIGGHQTGEIEVRDESTATLWLTELLGKGPRRFDEIDPLWKQETLRGQYRGDRGLRELLEDYFVLMPGGTYRIPDDHERQSLKGQEDNRKFRECDLFLQGRLEIDPSTENKFDWIEVLTRREEWEMVLGIERTLEADPSWRARSGAKDAMDRIRYAKVMMQKKPESGKPMKQKSLF